MATEFDGDQAYGQFLAMGRAASTAGQYEVTDHAFMAALHCAEGAADTARIGEVARLCREQLQVIDTTAPAHRLSSETAKAHGHRSVFEMGAVMAEAGAKRVESQQRLAEHRRGASA